MGSWSTHRSAPLQNPRCCNHRTVCESAALAHAGSKRTSTTFSPHTRHRTGRKQPLSVVAFRFTLVRWLYIMRAHGDLAFLGGYFLQPANLAFQVPDGKSNIKRREIEAKRASKENTKSSWTSTTKLGVPGNRKINTRKLPRPSRTWSRMLVENVGDLFKHCVNKFTEVVKSYR